MLESRRSVEVCEDYTREFGVCNAGGCNFTVRVSRVGDEFEFEYLSLKGFLPCGPKIAVASVECDLQALAQDRFDKLCAGDFHRVTAEASE